MVQERDKASRGLLVGGVGGTVFGTMLGLLLAGKPAQAATPEENWNYLIQWLELMAQGNATIIDLLNQIKAAQGAPIEVTVKTPWTAVEPEQIFNQAIRSVRTFDTDKMVDCTNVKRILFKVESSLDQATVIQVVGNIAESFLLVTNIGPPLPCVANGNISVGLAFDDWHPFTGIRITTGVAPTAGMLKVWAVIQE